MESPLLRAGVAAVQEALGTIVKKEDPGAKMETDEGNVKREPVKTEVLSIEQMCFLFLHSMYAFYNLDR